MHSRKIVLLCAAVLGALAVAGFVPGLADLLHLNATKNTANLALALVAVGASFLGARVCNVFLVSLGLLLCIDAFMGMTRGLFYLDFAALGGEVIKPTGAARLLASLPHALLGAFALVQGLRLANRDARSHTRGD